MRYRLILLGALLCLMAFTVSAQDPFPNWGPYNPATTGSGYPANLCTSFTSYVCIIAELCSFYKGNCTAAGPGGNVQDTGGLGDHQLWMTTSSGAYVEYTSNSSSYSQGYIVVIGTPYLSYSFAGVDPVFINGTECFYYGGATQFQAVNTFNQNNASYYYRNLSLCE